MLKADEAAVLKAQQVLIKATVRGTDPVRALDELGLLHHERLRRQIMADTLSQAADLLYQTTVKQLAAGQRAPQTPLDTKRCVELWLREQAAQIIGADK